MSREFSLVTSEEDLRNSTYYLALANSNKETKQIKDSISDRIKTSYQSKIQLVLNNKIKVLIIIHSMTFSHHEHLNSNILSIFDKAVSLNIPVYSYRVFDKNPLEEYDYFRIKGINMETKSLEYVASDFAMDFELFNATESEDEGSDRSYLSDDEGSQEKLEEKTEEEEVVEEEEEVDLMMDFKEIGYYEDVQVDKKKDHSYLIDSIKRSCGYIFQLKSNQFRLHHNIQDSVRNFSSSMNGFTLFLNERFNLVHHGKLSNAHKQYQFTGHTIAQTAVGKNHLLLLDKSNMVFSLGSNEYNQLGVPSHLLELTHHHSSILSHVSRLESIAMVACGDNFSSALTTSGLVFTWGQNEEGQLGLGHKNRVSILNRVSRLSSKKITYISCGSDHMVALDSNNNIYAWGSNLHCQYPNQPTKPSSSLPLLVDQTNCFKKIYTHSDFTIVSKEPNQVEFFGTENFPIQDLVKNLAKEFSSIHDYQLVTVKYKPSVKVLNPYYSLKFMLQTAQSFEKLNHYFQLIRSELSVSELNHLTQLAIQYNRLDFFKNIFSFRPYPLVLHDCSSYTTTDIARYLIKNSLVNIDGVDSMGQTALHLCALKNNEHLGKLLLESCCNRNVKDLNGLTALHIAVQSSFISFSLILAKHGAQAIPDKNMKTPVQYAPSELDKSVLQSVIFTNEIFISYAHKDSEFVSQLRLNLERFSLRCWLDEYRLQAGCDWRAEITKGLENCQYVFFVISEASANSLWCRKELKIARELGKHVIPIQLHETYIDPVIRGIFHIQPKSVYSTLSPEQINEELYQLSKIVKGNNSSKYFQSNDHLMTSYERSRMIYLTFSNCDRKLSSLVKEMLIERGIPAWSRDDIFGVPDPKDDEFSPQNLKKSKIARVKEKQERERLEKERVERFSKAKRKLHYLNIKLERNLEKSPEFFESQQYYQIYSDIHKYQKAISDMEIEFSKPVQTSSSNVEEEEQYIPDETFDSSKVDHSQFYQWEERVEKAEDTDAITLSIKSCLMHVIICSKNSDLKFIENEFSISKRYDKTCLVITPNLEFKKSLDSSSPLKQLPWFEIQYQKEDLVISNVVYNYEMLEKTLNVMHQQAILIKQHEIEAEEKRKRDLEDLQKQKKLKKQQLLLK